MGVVIFNGKSSIEYGVQVETPPEYHIPERDYVVTHVPGRNGDLVQDTGSYQNVTRKYTISFYDKNCSYTEMTSKLIAWLLSSGYAKLEDTYEPEYYRIAYYMADTEFENILGLAGKGDLEFTCKPQRFLKTGDYPITISPEVGGTILHNPTGFTAKPIIRIVGNGIATLAVGSETIVVGRDGDLIDGSIEIDCELMDAHRGPINCNSKITLSDKRFPTLKSGNTIVSYAATSGTISHVEVVPRWWTL